MSGRVGHILFAVVVVSAAGFFGLGLADSAPSYTLETTTSIDTPTRTISIDGENYTVSAVGVINTSTKLHVTVSRPGDAIFTVYLYNTDRQIVESVRRANNGTYTLQTSGLEAGTYVLALNIDGIIRTIQPVVISGHQFTIDAPTTVKPGDSISVTATVSNNPYMVDVVLFNKTWSQTATAARIGDNTYNAVLTAPPAPGEYRLYVGARGNETFDGRRVLTGISSTHTIKVEGKTTHTTSTPPSTTATTPPTTTPQPTTSTSPPTTTVTQTTPTHTTQPPTTTTTPPNQTTVQLDTTTPHQTTTSTPSTTNADNTTTQEVITPRTTTPPAGTATGTSVPGFTAWIAIVAVSLGILLFHRDP